MIAGIGLRLLMGGAMAGLAAFGPMLGNWLENRKTDKIATEKANHRIAEYTAEKSSLAIDKLQEIEEELKRIDEKYVEQIASIQEELSAFVHEFPIPKEEIGGPCPTNCIVPSP